VPSPMETGTRCRIAGPDAASVLQGGHLLRDASVNLASLPARAASDCSTHNCRCRRVQPSQSVQYAWPSFCQAICERCRTRKQDQQVNSSSACGMIWIISSSAIFRLGWAVDDFAAQRAALSPRSVPGFRAVFGVRLDVGRCPPQSRRRVPIAPPEGSAEVCGI
jgi:hypothetical protein